MTLEERAKKLAKYLEGKVNDWAVIESHFREIRNEALEEAAQKILAEHNSDGYSDAYLGIERDHADTVRSLKDDASSEKKP